MFLFRNGLVAVLLLILILTSVRGSFRDEKTRAEAVAKVMMSYMQDPWIVRIDSLMRSSDTACAQEFAAMSEAITAQQMWALEMVDASSKLQSGILKGNVRDLGMYDECVEAKGQYNGTNVQGQHCTVTFSTISSAVCVPSSCNTTEIHEILSGVIQDVSAIAGLNLEISAVRCVPADPENFTTGEILTIFFFSAVGAFIIFCTICEFVKKCRPAGVSPVINELSKFSLYKNSMALLSTKVSPQMMPAIQGIRFISMCWIVLGHRYGNVLRGVYVNHSEFFEWLTSWSAVCIQVAPFAVDTFFLISGFLMAYLFLKSKKSGKTTNIPMMYVHRYLRLTPCFAVLLLFTAVLLHRIANGPIWEHATIAEVEPCQKNWWVNLLYIQNFVHTDDIMCLQHSWYLAIDMQFFLLSPFILYPIYRWPKYGLGLLYLYIFAAVVTPGVTLAINSYSDANLGITGFENYNRGCPYLVGMLLGADAINGKRHFNKVSVAIGWVVACILMLPVMLATKWINDPEFEYKLELDIAAAFLLRPFWSIAIAWIVYACSFGYGGAVTRFLSLPIFLPLSRLSYCIYLVHFPLQAVKVSAMQISGRFTNFAVINEFWADLAVCIALAFILSVFFESPAVVLEKMLFNRGQKPSSVQEPKTNEEGGVDNKGMKET